MVSVHSLSMRTAAGALLGAVVLSLTLSSCAPSDSSAGRAGDGASQSDDTSADGDASTPDRDTQDEDMQSTPFPNGNILDEELSGQDAIDALGDNIDMVAKRVGKSPEELEELLLRDPSAHVTPRGFIVYRDSFPTPNDKQ